MKRTIPHLLSTALLGSLLFTGCNTTETTSSTSADVAAPIQPTQSTVWSAPKAETAATAKPVRTPSYPEYHAEHPLKGYLRSIGSDSMDQVIADWETAFAKHHPKLRFRHEGKGSSTAIPALLEGRSDIGPMSRAMKSKEIDAFKAKFGYAPSQYAVAKDALAVFVHPSNPILQSGLSMEQLKQIFAESATPITRWGQLGLTGEWAQAPVRLHGRNPASGTYAFFKSKALNKDDYRAKLTEHPGSAGVVEAVSRDPYSIGYSGIAYKTEAVRTVALENANNQLVDATEANAVSGSYALARDLYVTLNLNSTSGTTALQKEFLKFAFSREAQAIVRQVGYFPVSIDEAQQRLQQLQ